MVKWHLRAMSSITIPLSDEDFEFLRAYTRMQGTSAEAFLARQARNLREQLQMPIHPAVAAASGIVSSEVSAEQAHLAHVEEKHS
jgi:hypothetical protein